MHLTKIIQLEGKQDYTKITRLSDFPFSSLNQIDTRYDDVSHEFSNMYTIYVH